MGRRSVLVLAIGVALFARGATPAGARVTPATRVSVNRVGRNANGASSAPAVSADGRYVAFVSLASDLVRGDDNDAADVFVRDLVAGTTALVSVSRFGGVGNAASDQPSISADGRVVAFRSAASDLVSHDTNGVDDVFVRDIAAVTNTRVSVATDGTQADYESEGPYISGDGGIVAFTSYASNLAPRTRTGAEVFTHDLRNGTTEIAGGHVGESACGEGPFARRVSALSADATHVAILAECPGQVSLYDRALTSGVRRLVDSTATGTGSGGSLTFVRYSADGSRMAWIFSSRSETLVKVFDPARGVRHQIDPRSTGVSWTGLSMSADGRRLLYVGGDGRDDLGFTHGQERVYSYDLRSHAIRYVSVPLGGPTAEANGPCGAPALSADGAVAAFACEASDIVRNDRNGVADVFARTVASAPPVNL